MNEKTKKVLVNVMIVKTRNSTYRIWGTNKNGERSISRDEKPLDFNRCKIRFLEIGKDMELDCIGASHPHWYTSEVVSIE